MNAKQKILDDINSVGPRNYLNRRVQSLISKGLIKEYTLTNSYQTTKEYLTRSGYSGQQNISISIYGNGDSVREMVNRLRRLPEGMNSSYITKITTVSLCLLFNRELIPLITGYKKTWVINDCNGGVGEHLEVTPLFDSQVVLTKFYQIPFILIKDSYHPLSQSSLTALSRGF